MTVRPINWIECKEQCLDCPLRTDDTKKDSCRHLWRVVVGEWRELCDVLVVDDDELPAAPFDLPEVLYSMGATISRGLVDGGRPSVQAYEDEPQARPGYIKLRIQN